jgi:hypothetical protein
MAYVNQVGFDEGFSANFDSFSFSLSQIARSKPANCE